MMKVIHVPDELPETKAPLGAMPHLYRTPNSIFLAGPTPRSSDVRSWRHDALRVLDELDFDGHVFIPETKDWGWCGEYQRQVFWEWDALGRAESVLFWVPRTLATMPAFTTNIEFGMMASLHPERVVLGYPPGAHKVRYLDAVARNYPRFIRTLGYPKTEPTSLPVYHDLKSSLSHCLRHIEQQRPKPILVIDGWSCPNGCDLRGGYLESCPPTCATCHSTLVSSED
jgi:hypothetical protein